MTQAPPIPARLALDAALVEQRAAEQGLRDAEARLKAADTGVRAAERAYAEAMLRAQGLEIGQEVRVDRGQERGIQGPIAMAYHDAYGLLRVTIKGHRPGRGYTLEQVAPVTISHEGP